MIRLLEITEENFEHFQSPILEIEKSSFPSPWGLNAFAEEINRPISHFWALLVGEALEGYICFWTFSGEAHLMKIAVHPEVRGKGFGRYLLSKMIELGRSMAVQTVWLEVRPSNAVARGLYTKMGFRETGRRPRYYRDTNEEAIVMCLPLLDSQASCRDEGRKRDS
jgi:ribosomal-protein-alanine N-acetyltransferase